MASRSGPSVRNPVFGSAPEATEVVVSDVLVGPPPATMVLLVLLVEVVLVELLLVDAPEVVVARMLVLEVVLVFAVVLVGPPPPAMVVLVVLVVAAGSTRTRNVQWMMSFKPTGTTTPVLPTSTTVMGTPWLVQAAGWPATAILVKPG